MVQICEQNHVSDATLLAVYGALPSRFNLYWNHSKLPNSYR